MEQTHPLKAWRMAQRRKHIRWRRPTSMSLAEAARMVGVATSTWESWEKWPQEDGHKMPRPMVMVKLCALTGLSPNDFYPEFARDAESSAPLRSVG